MTTRVDPTPTLATRELRDFFDRLAAGDYHNLAKELDISGRPAAPLLSALEHEIKSFEDEVTPDTSIQSIDSVESFKFQPTAEGLRRAAALLRGDDSRERDRPPTPEEEEAFQFTFRLMIHNLYSISDFAKMVDDVVSTSQERFKRLSLELKGRPKDDPSFSFAYQDDEDSIASMQLASPSDASSLLSSSPSSSAWAPHPLTKTDDEDSDLRAVKKRIVGRKLSVVDTSVGEVPSGSPSWVYDATVASVESPSSYFDETFSPVVTSSPSRSGYIEGGDYGSRKRRFSFLAARGL